MTEQELQEQELEEAQKYLMSQLAKQGPQALTQAPEEQKKEVSKVAEEGSTQDQNVFKRGVNKVKEHTNEFIKNYPGLIKAAGKSAALITGLQVTRWICQTFL